MIVEFDYPLRETAEQHGPHDVASICALDSLRLIESPTTAERDGRWYVTALVEPIHPIPSGDVAGHQPVDEETEEEEPAQ